MLNIFKKRIDQCFIEILEKRQSHGPQEKIYEVDSGSFVTDLLTDIKGVPYRWDWNEKFGFTFEGKDKEYAELLLGGKKQTRSLMSSGYSDVRENICNKINDIAHYVFWHGKCFCNVDTDYSNEEFLAIISKESILRFPLFYVKFAHGPLLGQFNKVLLYRKTSEIFKISIFSNIFDEIKYRIILRILQFSRPHTPQFAIDDMHKGKTGFDSMIHRLLRIKFSTYIAGSYFWNKSLMDSYINNYYLEYRKIQRELKIIRIYKKIIDQLNSIFKKSGKDVKITISGIPDEEKLSDFLTYLQRGEIKELNKKDTL